MRTAFIDTLCRLAEDDKQIWLLSGDLGFSVLEKFSDRWPERYVNVGIAEQNLIGVAAGLASCGRIVFVYSIANFPTFRCLEQLRNDVAYHQLNVKVVSVGGGFTYGTAGYTHHGIEDLAILRVLPGMTILAPADPVEAASATEALASRPGPAYLRLGKASEPVLHSSGIDFAVGKAITVRNGLDVTLISTGGMLRQALETAETLRERHQLEARVLSFPSLKPLDEEAVRLAAEQTRGVVVLEEHRAIGGLGSAVAEILAQMRTPHAPLRIFGIPDTPIHRVGSREFLIDALGDVTDVVLELLNPQTEAAGDLVPLASV